jgi:hypothetical protein
MWMLNVLGDCLWWAHENLLVRLLLNWNQAQLAAAERTMLAIHMRADHGERVHGHPDRSTASRLIARIRIVRRPLGGCVLLHPSVLPKALARTVLYLDRAVGSAGAAPALAFPRA